MGLAQGPKHERSPSAGRQTHDHIPSSRPPLAYRPRSRLRIILGPLLRPENRLGPAGQNRLNFLGVGMERGRHLACIQNPQPAAGSGADIKQPSTTVQRIGDQPGCPADLRSGLA